MRYMMIVKSNARTEAGTMPDERFGKAMEKYNQELIDAGVFVTGEGLLPSANGARITLDKGEFSVTRGPFGNAESLIGGYWVIEAASKAEAIEWAKRCPFKVDGSSYADGTGQLEVRAFIEMPAGEDDLAFMSDFESDEDAKGTPLHRFISIVRSDATIESGAMPSSEVLAAMGAAMEPLVRNGTLIAAEGLQPSSEGVRVNFANGTPVVTDGPFAETKELLGGFAMLRVPSLDEALELTKVMMQIETTWRDGPIEFEVRQLYGT